MQETTAHYQAALLDEQPWYCYLGTRQPDAPACSSLTAEEVLATGSCNCSDSWTQKVLPHFSGVDNKRVLSFMPKLNLAMNSARHFLTLQVLWNYNTSAQADPTLGYPNLWLIVYDSATSPWDAYLTGDSPMTLTNANGVTTLALGISYIERNASYHYRYSIDVNTSPFFGLVCDVSGNPEKYTPCYSSIWIRPPRLERTVVFSRQDKT
jgi:hypothetical protein